MSRNDNFLSISLSTGVPGVDVIKEHEHIANQMTSSLRMENTLVYHQPRFTAPWGEQGETLVWAGHVLSNNICYKMYSRDKRMTCDTYCEAFFA